MATALVAAACRQGILARFFSTSALVMMLRRAKDEDGLDKELGSLAQNQLLAIDELGYLPIDMERARILFQVTADGYDKRSLIITTDLESPAGERCSGTITWPQPSSTAWSTTDASCNSAVSPTGSKCSHEITNS